MSELTAMPAELDAATMIDRIRSWLTDVRVMTRRNLIHIRREPMQALRRDHPAGAVHGAVRLHLRLGHGRARRRQLQGFRHRRAADHEPHHLGRGHGDRSQHRPLDGRDRSPAHSAHVADGDPRRPLALRPAGGGDLQHVGRRHRPPARLASGCRPRRGGGGLRPRLLFSYALTWAMACLGMLVSSAESAQGIVFIVMFPLAFVSNVFAATQNMPPGWPRSPTGTRSVR